jgi:hypothetical protein
VLSESTGLGVALKKQCHHGIATMNNGLALKAVSSQRSIRHRAAGSRSGCLGHLV